MQDITPSSLPEVQLPDASRALTGQTESGACRLRANEAHLLTANFTPPSARTPRAATSAHHLPSAPSSPSTRGCLLALACRLPIVALHCIDGAPVQPAIFSRTRTEHKYTSPWRSLRSLLFSLQQACQVQELFFSYAISSFLFFIPKGLVLVVHTLKLIIHPTR